MTKGVRVVFIKKKQLLPLTLLLLASSVEVQAGPRDQAKKLYSSLTGNTANKAIADKYEKMVKDGKIKAAAKEIVESNQGFYNVTLKVAYYFSPCYFLDILFDI